MRINGAFVWVVNLRIGGSRSHRLQGESNYYERHGPTQAVTLSMARNYSVKSPNLRKLLTTFDDQMHEGERRYVWGDHVFGQVFWNARCELRMGTTLSISNWSTRTRIVYLGVLSSSQKQPWETTRTIVPRLRSRFSSWYRYHSLRELCDYTPSLQ